MSVKNRGNTKPYFFLRYFLQYYFPLLPLENGVIYRYSLSLYYAVVSSCWIYSLEGTRGTKERCRYTWRGHRLTAILFFLHSLSTRPRGLRKICGRVVQQNGLRFPPHFEQKAKLLT